MYNELKITVPAPFAGIDELGFTARYMAQSIHEPLRDVPFIFEGQAAPMQLLIPRLDLLAQQTAESERYSWTSPIQLTDQTCLLGFKDRTLSANREGTPGWSEYIANLVRPVALRFLRDCVRIGDLRLSEDIAISIDTGKQILTLDTKRREIIDRNGNFLLFDLGGLQH